MPSDQPDGREYRDLLLRLIDGIKDDVGALREGLGGLRGDMAELEKVARAAFLRVEQVEARVSNLAGEARASTISLAEIKAVSKTAGYLAGGITGILGGVLAAWIIRMLHL